MKLLLLSFAIAFMFVVGGLLAATVVDRVGAGYGVSGRFLRMPFSLPDRAINYFFPQILAGALKDVSRPSELSKSPKFIGLALAVLLLNVLLYGIPAYFVLRLIFKRGSNKFKGSETPPPPPVFGV